MNLVSRNEYSHSYVLCLPRMATCTLSWRMCVRKLMNYLFICNLLVRPRQSDITHRKQGYPRHPHIFLLPPDQTKDRYEKKENARDEMRICHKREDQDVNRHAMYSNVVRRMVLLLTSPIFGYLIPTSFCGSFVDSGTCRGRKTGVVSMRRGYRWKYRWHELGSFFFNSLPFPVWVTE